MNPNKIDRILARGIEVIFPIILLMTVVALVLTIIRFAMFAYQSFMYGDSMGALMAGLVAVFFLAIGACWWQADRDERY